jgi:hypothetical protein
VERHNSCTNTRAVIDYIERHHGEAGGLLHGLDEHLRGIKEPLTFLRQPHNWVSAEVVRVMYDNARRISGDRRVAFRIGYESVTHQSLGYIQQILMKALGSPRMAVARIRSLNEKFNRNKDIELLSLDKESAELRLRWREDLALTRDFCLMNQGIYSALATLWGVPPAAVEERSCQFRGDEACEYVVRWKNPSLAFRLRHLLSGRRQLLTDTLAEMERDKALLEETHHEVMSLNQTLQAKIDQIMSVQHASAAILSELDLDKLLPAVLDLFLKTIGFSRSMIMLVQEDSRSLRFVDGVGITPEEKRPLSGYRVPLDRTQNLLARVANSGNPFICDDAERLNLNPHNLIVENYRPGAIVILPLVARGKVIGVLAADRGRLQGLQPKIDRDFLSVFANQVALAIENAQMYRNLKESILRSMQSLASALEAKDPYTAGHSQRVRQLSERLGLRLGLGQGAVDEMANGCLLHDIGKIGVNRRILNKEGALTEEERQVVRSHAGQGYSIIKPLALGRATADIVRHHHERYDGRGYPRGLSGERIPLPVRIVSVCDAFDAMTSDRPYRKGLSTAEALTRLQDGSGSQFDPRVVEEFSSMCRQGEAEDLVPTSGRAARLRAV